MTAGVFTRVLHALIENRTREDRRPVRRFDHHGMLERLRSAKAA